MWCGLYISFVCDLQDARSRGAGLWASNPTNEKEYQRNNTNYSSEGVGRRDIKEHYDQNNIWKRYIWIKTTIEIDNKDVNIHKRVKSVYVATKLQVISKQDMNIIKYLWD